MRKLMIICMVALLCGVGCNSAMRGGAGSGGLKAGTPGTLTLKNGGVVYDLNGKWDIVTRVGSESTLNGVLEIEQQGNQFVGTLDSGNYPGLETSERVRGTLEGTDIDEIKFNTIYGWINSSGSISDEGKTIEIETAHPSEGFSISSTLEKQ